jgi:hypothetical protein
LRFRRHRHNGAFSLMPVLSLRRTSVIDTVDRDLDTGSVMMRMVIAAQQSGERRVYWGRILLAAILLGAMCSMGSVQSFAEDEQPAVEGDWIIAPEICRGHPWSATAKAAGWEVDAERSVCRATADNGPLFAHTSPLVRGRFVVDLASQMQRDATHRLFMDEIAFDLSDNGQTIHVAGAPDYLTFHVERQADQRWSLLNIDRKQETLIVTLNGKEVFRFNDKGRSYERVGLKPIGGAMEVNRFSLTGNLAFQTRETPTSED